MTAEIKKKTPWYLWPFSALWNLLTWLVTLVGRFLAAILGFILMVLGAVLTITLIGAPLGIPLVIFGVLLVIRSIF
jgi:hypothetical protein